MRIANRETGVEFEPLVIAEIVINHKGSLKVAMEMVDGACLASVDVFKYQTHIVENEMAPATKKVIPGNADVSIY